MEKITRFFSVILHFALLCIVLTSTGAVAQVYVHNFGTTDFSSHPYTGAPTTLEPHLSGSSWTNTTGSWSTTSGAGGNPSKAITVPNTSGNPVVTLTFNVQPGYQLNVTAFNFWRQRSNTGAQNWTLAINGTTVGTGTAPTAGAATGQTNVSNPVSNLTGTVTVTMALSGATGTGTFRIDDFTLYGSVTSTCTAPTIASVFPASGPENTIVTIEGSGFEAGTGTTAVQFNGVNAAGFSVVSNTVIKAVVPGAATTGAVTITTNGCTATTSTFTVIDGNCAATVTATEIYISELYDQKTGSGGMIEIFNPTANPITLTGVYTLQRFGDVTDTTPTAGYILPLTGTIAPGSTYLVAGTTPVAAQCNAPAENIGFTAGFNENDKFQLLKNGVVIDVVNAPASQPGYNVIRQADAVAPSSVYVAGDWDVTLHNNDIPNTYCSNLGIHAADPALPPGQISAEPQSQTVCEHGQAQYSVTLDNASGYTFQWRVLNSSGVWVNVTNDEHYSGANTPTLTITDTPLTFLGNQYYCVATAPSCTLVSNAVQLTVSPVPVVVAIPLNASCLVPTGSILIVPSIGVGLTYSTNGVDFSANTVIDGLAPGNYTLTIKSAANCYATMPITINPQPTVAAVTANVVQPTCAQPTGTITVTGPLDPTYTYSINGTTYQSGLTFSNLAPGTYSVTAQTVGGCESTATTITINPVPTVDVAVATATTQPTCAQPTGTITITSPTGAGLQYSIDNGANYQSSTVFAGLTPGNYFVTVQNAGGCTSVTPAAITIDAVPGAPAVAVAAATTQPTCAQPTGTITITSPTGAGLQYSIDNGANYQSSTVFAGLTPGNYFVTVQNAGGCTSVTPAAITIDAVPGAPAVAVAAATTQPTCAQPTGTITITSPTGAGLQYSIDNGANYQSSTVFAGLTPGNYFVTVQNAGGCTSVTPAAITIDAVPGAPAVAVAAATTQPTCAQPTGTITITSPTGAGLQYSIDNGANYQSSTVFAGLTPGNYFVTVQNAGGCTSVTPAAITIDAVPAAPAVAVAAATTQPTCAQPTGTITITSPTGAGLQYSIDNGANYQSSTVFAGLTPGNYFVTVQNAGGCTSVTPAAITIDAVPAAPAVAVAAATTQPTCAQPTGTITITSPTGAGLQYSIDNGANYQSSTVFAGLTPGNYFVTVQNAGGCTSVTPAAITIDAVPAAPAVAVAAATTQPTCAQPTGTITITSPTGAGLQYSIDNGANYQSSTVFAGLTPGNYFVTVQNAGGCTSVTPAAITIDAVPGTPAVAVAAATTQPTCAQPTGTITITSPTGAGLQYSIDNGANYQSSTVFAGLTPGNYFVTVQNAGGCTSVTPAAITIDAVPGAPAVAVAAATTQPTCAQPTGTITITSPTGAGLQYSIDNGANYQSSTVFAGLTPGNYFVTVQNAGGCTSVTPAAITIDAVPVGPATPQVTVTDPSCADPNSGIIIVTDPIGGALTYSIGGGFQANNKFEGLAAGTYTVTVMNGDGCDSSTEVVINPALFPVVGDVVVTQPTCGMPEGSITINTPAGTGYMYSIDGTNYTSAATFAGLQPGTAYNVTVQSPEGCISDAVTYTIDAVPGMPVISTLEGCTNGAFDRNYTLEAVALNGSFDPSSAQFTWTYNGATVGSNQSTFNVTDFVTSNNIDRSQYPLTFNVTVSNGADCTANAQFIVESTFCSIPKGISPNADGMNDTFDLTGMNVTKVNIFNRYGEKVYSKDSNYSNEWHGQSNSGDELPTGTYYYEVEAAGGHSQTGWVYINRME